MVMQFKFFDLLCKKNKKKIECCLTSGCAKMAVGLCLYINIYFHLANHSLALIAVAGIFI